MPNEPSEEEQGEDEEPVSIKNIRKRLDEVTKEKEESEKQAADYLDRLKRLQADMENLQKITKRQVDTVTKQASERLVANLLPVLDAFQHAGRLSKSSDSMRTDEVSVGLKMLYEQLADILFAEGLEEIPTVGHPLDPDRHEVVGYSETDDKPENTVIEEVRTGYSLNGKVIRPSLVIVSRPRGHEAEPEEEDGGVAD